MKTKILIIKRCTKCGESKTELEFYSKGAGLASECKECNKKEKRDWYAHNRDKQKRRVRKYSEEDKQLKDPTYGTHACNRCLKTEPEVVFNLRKYNGKYYKRHLCTVCYKEYRRETAKTPRVASEENRRRRALRLRLDRMNPTLDKLASLIIVGSRKADKVRGRENDLDRKFVLSTLASGCCVYCGDDKIRLTLDRIDNSLGHKKDNVVLACIRCNGIRSNMPFDAWMHIAPTIRSARDSGLFGNWFGRTFRGGEIKISDLGYSEWKNVEHDGIE